VGNLTWSCSSVYCSKSFGTATHIGTGNFCRFYPRTRHPAFGKFIKLLPDNQEKVFYSDNGSTAVEVALKMCIQFAYNQGKERQKS
jgi:adenosylmethionine-8-amino-7-oxononanoate aminotransferase